MSCSGDVVSFGWSVVDAERARAARRAASVPLGDVAGSGWPES